MAVQLTPSFMEAELKIKYIKVGLFSNMSLKMPKASFLFNEKVKKVVYLNSELKEKDKNTKHEIKSS